MCSEEGFCHVLPAWHRDRHGTTISDASRRRRYRHATVAQQRRELCLKACGPIMLPRAVCHGNGQHVEAPAAQLRVPQPRRTRRPRLAGVWQRREVGRAVDLDRDAPPLPLEQRVNDARAVADSRASLQVATTLVKGTAARSKASTRSKQSGEHRCCSMTDRTPGTAQWYSLAAHRDVDRATGAERTQRVQDGGFTLRWAVISRCFLGCREAGLPQRFQRNEGRCWRESEEGGVRLHTQQAVLACTTWQNENRNVASHKQ